MINRKEALPRYLELFDSGELNDRIKRLFRFLESCELCPRKCHVNRLIGEKGVCNSGKELMISSFNPHFGEEEPLIGKSKISFIAFVGASKGGSGTIFLTNCNLLCLYCQNYDISHQGYGRNVSLNTAARMMTELQNRGCYNINFVTPTHYTPQIIDATRVAIQKGLRIPIVWNCSGYENVEVIKLLDGIVDIYMPDIKYSDSEPARKYSKAPDYFERCKEAVREMHRQVGDLQVDDKGIAYRGLLIRHLVLPNTLAGSEDVLTFIANDLSTNSYVNIMSQYRPAGEAYRFNELNRRPNRDEITQVIKIAISLGLTRGFNI